MMPAEYRKFAPDCMREAECAESAAMHLTMIGLARIGFELEQYVAVVGNEAEPDVTARLPA